MLREAAILLLCTLLAAAGTHYLHPRAPSWYLVDEPIFDDEVTLADISLRWHDDVLWIDARPRSQYEQGHVAGALMINEQELDQLLFQQFEKLQDNTKPVIVYCGSETCQASRKMKDYLKQRITSQDLYILHGGWKAWSAKNGEGAK